MKQFFTAVGANLFTIALCVVGSFILLAGIGAAVSSGGPAELRDKSILVVDLDRGLSDRSTDAERAAPWDAALGGDDASSVPLRSAVLALRQAIDDDHISGVLLRGSISASGYESGYAALREFRTALLDFRTRSKKPVHAFLANPDTRDYYLASAASTITLDPFGSIMLTGMGTEEVFLAGLFEKYGIGVQVTRVGRFKAAVEPLTRRDMSPENRLQTRAYLGDMWTEVKRAIAQSRSIDTAAVQAVSDSLGIVMTRDAMQAKLVDRVAYFDELLTDLERLAGVAPSEEKGADSARGAGSAGASKARKDNERRDTQRGRPRLPQITLDEYGRIAVAKARTLTASQAVAIVYAQGDIVDGNGGGGSIGGDALARELRRLRDDGEVKSVVLRVNSPGGSAVASETIRRELALINQRKPVIVSMGTVAASGGYWISTASRRVFAEPNTITGSIGVFGILPNVKGLANRNGVTFDTVKTAKFADIYSLSRPRTPDELTVIQRSVDAIYSAFIERVSSARKLSPDSVAQIAEGRVWSGARAVQIGLVDSIGGLEDAVRSAAKFADLTGDYDVREYPRRETASERISSFFGDDPEPVARVRATGPQGTNYVIAAWLSGRDPGTRIARDVVRELGVLLSYNDPRGVYARLPFVLTVR